MIRTAADLAPCGVRHVDMSGPFAPISAAPGERAVYVVFWRQGRPVGFRMLLLGELPVPAAAVPPLAAAAAGQAVLASEPDGVDAAEYIAGVRPVSIVICTRDRPGDLARCLDALLRCKPAPDEIVVVDNAPSDDASKEVVKRISGVRYLRESQAGLSHARNAGVRAAKGEIVAFTDDDVEVPENWIARLAVPFDDPDVACVTGLVIPADLSGPAACLFEFDIGGFGKELTGRRFDHQYLRKAWWFAPEVWRIGAGANMAIRRRAFSEIGLFDPRLGVGASGCSEDSEFWFRLLRAGLVCYYDPAVVVFHRHRPGRAELSRQLRAYARGHVVALFVQFAQDRRPCHMIRAFWILPRYFIKRTFGALIRRDRDRIALIIPQLWGCLEGQLNALRWLRRGGPPGLRIKGGNL